MKKVLSLISCILIIALTAQNSFALSVSENSNEKIIAENIEIMENELEQNNTNVATELNEMMNEYRQIASTMSSREEIEQINRLITTLEELLIEYQLYADGITTYKYHAIYTPAIAAAIATFHGLFYLLSAELLTHAKDNTVLDSNYVPTYGARARNSDVITQIAYSDAISGSATFEKGSNFMEKDLYYAIHNFDFSKSFPTAKVVYIKDRYDFKHGDYNFDPLGIAVNTMYRAQEAGYLVPYYVNIKVDVA